MTACDGQEALETLEREEVDIIVSDVMMPNMDGNELCRRVKNDINTSHIAFILLTAKTTVQNKVEGMESGADAFVEKPFALRQLHLQIENLIKTRQRFHRKMQELSGNVTETQENTSATGFAASLVEEYGLTEYDANFIENLQQEVRKHLADEEFSYDTLAAQLSMSRSSLYRKIKLLIGQSPQEYLKSQRMIRAAELIRKGMRISDVMLDVGFTSSSYFAKCFRTAYGVLPKDFKSIILIGLLLFAACSQREPVEPRTTLMEGCYPQAVEHEGNFYFTRQEREADCIRLWKATSLEALATAEPVTVWTPNDSIAARHIWSPEIHRIQGQWYIYFEADDGNTDNHQLYVLACQSQDPMKGPYEQRGPITTDTEINFGIHPTTFCLRGQQYLLWSGWQEWRNETETQCIYIASMQSPWQTSSPRQLLSQPEHEWERQWITPTGQRSAYPIYVNENPEVFFSPDSSRVFVGYSASGVWTPYSALGLLEADAQADLLSLSSWKKSEEPLFASNWETEAYGPGNVCIVGNQLLYEIRTADSSHKTICLKSLSWDNRGYPVLGQP